MTCREEILEVIAELGKPTFTPGDVNDAMQARGSRFKPTMIRTHVTSYMVANAVRDSSLSHVGYDDLVRIEQGVYRLAVPGDGFTRAEAIRAERERSKWKYEERYLERQKKLLELKAVPIERMEVVDGERFITTVGAAMLTELSKGRCGQLAKLDWPAIKLSNAWLIDLDSVLAYRAFAKPRNAGLEKMKGTMNYRHARHSEIFETRAGVITTAANLIRSFGFSWCTMVNLLDRGLPAQRFGTELIIYEDEWWTFIKGEWERPRLMRPRAIPKPEGVILGELIPSPLRGMPASEKKKGKFSGWTDWYVEQLRRGARPPTPQPLRRRLLKQEVPQ